MRAHSAFSIIQRALEEFNDGVDKARANQVQSAEAVASVEYEVEQLRLLGVGELDLIATARHRGSVNQLARGEPSLLRELLEVRLHRGRGRRPQHLRHVCPDLGQQRGA